MLIPENDLDLFHQLIETTLQGVIVTDKQRNIIYVNRAFTLSTGYEMEEVVGRNPRFLQSGRHDAAFYKTLWDTVHQTGHWQGELWNKRKNGEIFAEWQNIMKIKDQQGRVQYYAAIFSDITERKLIQKKLEDTNSWLHKISTTDSITHIANRYRFNKALHLEHRRTLRKQLPLSLIMLDIDYFKKYNDSYGHIMGDQCLKDVARALELTLGDRGLVARYGGEEFAVILPQTGMEGAAITAGQLHRCIAELNISHASSPFGRVTVSVGFATLNAEELYSVEKLLTLADEALYRAKEQGRNRCSD